MTRATISLPGMKIAWIGLGTMGEAMAGHLLDAGHELTVHNRTREREEGAGRAGSRARGIAGARRRGAPSSSACASRTRPTSRRSSSAPAASPRASSAAPSCWTARRSRPTPRAASRPSWPSAARGAVDAPVSGGSEGARKGQLTAFVGGEDAHVAFARPALEAFCRSITHLGGPGAGQAGKAVNQVLISGTYAALGEGLALGEREGLPLRGARRGARRRRGGLVDPPEPLRQRDQRQLSARLQDGAAPQGPAASRWPRAIASGCRWR